MSMAAGSRYGKLKCRSTGMLVAGIDVSLRAECMDKQWFELGGRVIMRHIQRVKSVMPATNMLELLDLSFPYRLPAAMLMAAHGYTAAAHKRALHD